MIFNPVIGMLHDVNGERWHPIYFREAPLPGNPKELSRHKSGGHHTKGFGTREEALKYVNEEMLPAIQKNAIGPVRTCLVKDFPWDGNPDTAVMVVFFSEGETEVAPLLGG